MHNGMADLQYSLRADKFPFIDLIFLQQLRVVAEIPGKNQLNFHMARGVQYSRPVIKQLAKCLGSSTAKRIW